MNTRPLPCCESLCGERGLVYLHLFFRPNGRTRYRSEVWRSSGISAGRRTGQPGCLAHSIAHDILRGLLFSRLHSIRPRHLYGIASAAVLSSRPPTRPGTVHKESIFALKCSRSKRNKPARSRSSHSAGGRRAIMAGGVSSGGGVKAAIWNTDSRRTETFWSKSLQQLRNTPLALALLLG